MKTFSLSRLRCLHLRHAVIPKKIRKNIFRTAAVATSVTLIAIPTENGDAVDNPDNATRTHDISSFRDSSEKNVKLSHLIYFICSPIRSRCIAQYYNFYDQIRFE